LTQHASGPAILDQLPVEGVVALAHLMNVRLVRVAAIGSKQFASTLSSEQADQD
jgi:hypothetical protein